MHSFKPETEWGSTQIGMEDQNLKPSKKTVAQVVKFISIALSIGNGFYNTTITRDPSTSKYIITASFESIPISGFIQKFSAAVLPREFPKRLKNFIEFSIHNAKLALPLGTRNLQLHLSGTPVIDGYKTVHLSAIIVRQGEKN